MAKYCQSKEIHYMDHETGEYITSTVERTYSYKLKTDEEFTMIYYNHVINALTNIKSKKSSDLLFCLVSCADYNTGEVTISAHLRLEICKRIGIDTKNFSRHINELKKNKLIVGGNGSYVINPNFFWKGDAKSRADKIKDKVFFVKFGFSDEPKDGANLIPE